MSGREMADLKSSTISTMDAEFFQSLNDFKTDILFNKTESILSKPPQIYRQVSISEIIKSLDFGC